jgi:isopentenyl diphosphate isomerase/L-lactate dehydrogenase-like FMN-dependent dehydrogenase
MGPINVFDYEALARERLDPTIWDYIAGGAEDEVTLRANRTAFERIRLRPRMLVDVSACDLTTTALGTPLNMPIFVAPMGYQALAHQEGEVAMARGAGAAGALLVASTLATRSLEEIAAAASGPLWFQLYVYAERQISAALVRRAEAAGYQALVLTVDLPRLGKRERDERNSFGLPPHLQMRNFLDVGGEEMPAIASGSALAAHAAANIDPSLTWEALDWLRSLTPLPVLVKGILTGEDATLAVAHGAAGIVVSNHGGRQLDGVAASIEALPEVVAAVGGRCEVFVDGGVRRGTDVLKALALGARAVLVGRPALWGLAANGAEGVQAVLQMLRDELELAMALAGRSTLAGIEASAVALPGQIN